MSAMEALIGIGRYLADHSESNEQEAINSLRRSDADYAGADYETGLELHVLFAGAVDFSDPAAGLRNALRMLIRYHSPWWARLAPYGRQRLATALTVDELQTFRAAGLMEAPPSDAAVTWWDDLAAEARRLVDEQLTEQGRYAEALSLEYEASRLDALGVTEAPKWIAIDDNSAGYDILSYDLTSYGLINRLIEVKSTRTERARLILSRGEWESALRFGEAYQFHVWKLPAEELTIKSVEEVARHIPADAGGGKWQTVEIVL
jgi:hypothetical protein